MGFNEKMTALADEVRTLSGTTENKSLDNLISDTTSANTEVETQSSLIGQIISALDGKTSGGSGEDVTEETSAYTTKLTSLETAVAALESELEGKTSGGSGANFETSVVTINSPILCRYLGTDFQFKEETTSTFKTIKNSIVCFGNPPVSSSGCNILFAGSTSFQGDVAMQLTETVVNIVVASHGGGGGN